MHLVKTSVPNDEDIQQLKNIFTFLLYFRISKAKPEKKSKIKENLFPAKRSECPPECHKIPSK